MIVELHNYLPRYPSGRDESLNCIVGTVGIVVVDALCVERELKYEQRYQRQQRYGAPQAGVRIGIQATVPTITTVRRSSHRCELKLHLHVFTCVERLVDGCLSHKNGFKNQVCKHWGELYSAVLSSRRGGIKNHFLKGYNVPFDMSAYAKINTCGIPRALTANWFPERTIGSDHTDGQPLSSHRTEPIACVGCGQKKFSGQNIFA